ncbi:uncharacterized protein [Nicotiana tomentosiformis]|uniref:uncharacterized protein n=1 Tax=Nicotiana tomentosiformis TaxID=4098 RepID=UPI00388C42CB
MKSLEVAKDKWPKELPGVLWAYQTAAKSSTGETPFSLMYGAEALTSVEVDEPTLRYSQTNEESNDKAMLINLKLLEGRRDLAHELNTGKLGPMWEGPYRISAFTGKGSYELENQNEDKLPNNWDVAHLKRFLTRQRQKAYYEDNNNKTFDCKANEQAPTRGRLSNLWFDSKFPPES